MMLMTEYSAIMQSLYATIAKSEQNGGALDEVVALLAEGSLTRERFDDIVSQSSTIESRQFRDGLLDILLHGLRTAVRDHCITQDEMLFVRQLTSIFGIREGELFERRRVEISHILEAEFLRMLDDERVDSFELAYQDALQRLFGLGYDQFHDVVRQAYTPIVDRAILAATTDGAASRTQRAELDRKLSALSTMYVLSATQRAALEHVP